MQPQLAPEMTRKGFLAWLSVALSAVIAAIVGVPAVVLALAPALKPAQTMDWVEVGPAENFKVGEIQRAVFTLQPQDKFISMPEESSAWVWRKGTNDFVVYSVKCTHLGCPVSWNAGAGLFICPCHGGVYNREGAVLAGPPPHALNRYASKVEGGQLLVLSGSVPAAA